MEKPALFGKHCLLTLQMVAIVLLATLSAGKAKADLPGHGKHKGTAAVSAACLELSLGKSVLIIKISSALCNVFIAKHRMKHSKQQKSLIFIMYIL